MATKQGGGGKSGKKVNIDLAEYNALRSVYKKQTGQTWHSDTNAATTARKAEQKNLRRAVGPKAVKRYRQTG